MVSQNYDFLCKFGQRLSGDANQASGELRALLWFMASASQPAWGQYSVVPEEGVELFACFLNVFRVSCLLLSRCYRIRETMMDKRITLLARVKRNGKYPYIRVRPIKGRILPPKGTTAFYLRYTENGERKTVPIAGAAGYRMGKFTVDSDYALQQYKQAHERLGYRVPRGFEPPKPVFIYFIRATLSNRIKIGATQNVQKRLGDLQVSNAEPLQLAASVLQEKLGLTESQIHQRFRTYRMRGEWFHSAPELEQFISKIKESSWAEQK